MKKLIVTLLLTACSIISIGQSVIAPEAKSFTLNTLAQDASGFSLSGFGANDILLCAIGLPTAPTGTTFYLTTTTNLTASIGYTITGNKTRLTFTGTMANINAALATLKVNTTATGGIIQISVSATLNPTGYYYYPVNGHFYKPVSTGAFYKTAKINAHATTFKGQEGYLLTLTSAGEEDFIKLNVPQSNIWFAATDEVTDGTWVIDDGPEKGTVMKTSNGPTAGNIVGVYNNWCGGEPNGVNHSEDYPVAKWNGAACWNDLANNWNNPYVIEYGTWTNPDDQTFTEFYSNSVNHSNGNILRTQFIYDFGNNLNKTLFRTKLFSNYNGVIQGSVDYAALNSLGKIDMTNGVDQTKVTIGDNSVFKPHFSDMKYYGASYSSLYNSIVTVSDVYLAFKQLSDKGVFGNSNIWFTTPIQFANADVDGNSIFNEQDCFTLLKHLLGEVTIWDGTNTLQSMAKFIKKSDYDGITNNTWINYTNTSTQYNLPSIVDGQLNSYNIAVTWKGDINLSHSAIPSNSGTINSKANFGLITKSTNQVYANIMSQLIGDSLYVEIKFNPNNNNIVGTQFQLNYDNTLLKYNKTDYIVNGTPINYSVNKETFISLGSLNNDGSQITSATYKISFSTIQKLNNGLGLITIGATEAVNKDGKSTVVKIQ